MAQSFFFFFNWKPKRGQLAGNWSTRTVRTDSRGDPGRAVRGERQDRSRGGPEL